MWKPEHSPKKKQIVARQQPQKNRLTTENVSEFSQEQEQLYLTQWQTVVDKKTKPWVDEQNKLNKQKRQNYSTKYIEEIDQTYPMQYARAQSHNLKRGGSEPNLPGKQNMVPQPTWALTEFVKHVADPLVDKGWNLHLKFGKGEPQKEEFIQGATPPKTSSKTKDKEKVCSIPREKQTLLEMGTGGGGRGKRGDDDGKRPPEDKVEFEDHLKKDDDEDDLSTETSFELEVTPEQLASVNPNRPILRLQLSPRKRVAMAAPGGGGSPSLGGTTET